MSAAADDIASVEQQRAVMDVAGATAVTIDPITVNVAMIVPAIKVIVISPALPIKNDVVLPDSERVPLERSPPTVLNMGSERGTTKREIIRAPYPSVRDMLDADSVKPLTSAIIHRSIKAMKAILDESFGAPGTNNGDVKAASIKSATLTPPSCMAA